MSFYLINQSRGKVGAFSTITVGVFSLDIYTRTHLEYPEAIAKTGDLLISMSGTVGNVAIVPEEIGQCSINQRVARVRLKEGVNKDYVCLFLNSILGELQLTRIGTGGLQTNISFNDIKKVKVILPPSEAQQRIAYLVDLARQRRKEATKLTEQAKREVAQYIEKEAENVLAPPP